MKRMKFIRVALFAVIAFMGTISLSAQTWSQPAAAAVVISNELNAMSELPLVPSQQLQQPQAGQLSSAGGCIDCALRGVKIQFLNRTLTNIKQGMDTGPAVEEVRSFLISNAQNNANALNLIQSGYVYMDSIL